MRVARRLGLPSWFCSLFLLINSQPHPGSRAQTGQENTPLQFSRSAWIAQHASQVRFSGGVLPSTSEQKLPTHEARREQNPAAEAQAIAGETSTTSPIQVSSDLLPTDSAAQPATHAEPYLDSNPVNASNLLGAWQENRFANGGARGSGFGASTDGGQTWMVGLIPHSSKASGGLWDKASDPWVAFGPNNRAYFASLLFNESNPDSAVGVSASADGGLTWGDPVTVTFSDRDFSDKEAVVVDTFPASPHFGTVYVAWDLNVAKADSVKQWIMVARSTDGGVTYQEPVRVRKKGLSNIGVIPRVAPDGSLYLVWLAQTGSADTVFLFSKSDDGGLNWSKPRAITDVQSRGEQGIRDGAGLPSFSVDPVTGNLYVAWQDSRFGAVDQTALIQSSDGGRTWSDPVRVSDGPGDAPAFTVAVAASGNRVAVSYYSLQNDPQRRFLTDRYVRISTDGGATFSPSVRATPTSFDIRMAARAGAASFLGDYTGLASGAGGFHLLWIESGIPSLVTGKPQPEAMTASAE